MICYAIKNKDHRYAKKYYIYEDENWMFCELNNATIFDNFGEAKETCEYINTYIFKNNNQAEVVKVEIREVEE